MAQATSPQNKDSILSELNLLLAFKAVAETADGKKVLGFIIDASKLGSDPHERAKNSGETQYTLGRQKVGRMVFDKLVSAGVEVSNTMFSKKSGNEIQELTDKYNKYSK